MVEERLLIGDLLKQLQVSLQLSVVFVMLMI